LREFDAILAEADGIMVARGDLGVELAAEEVPIVQKELIRKCYMAGKPVITATQMLHSMTHAPRPTRAEVSDVANAIYDFTSAVMLSGETSVGRFPVTCVETMARIAERAEDAIDYKRIFFGFTAQQTALEDTTSAVTTAAITTAYNIGARAVVTVSETGRTAQMLSRLRPDMPIIAVVSDERVYHRLSLNWGIMPVLAPHFETLEELHHEIVRLAARTGLVEPGDKIVLVAGVPVGRSGATNMIKVELIPACVTDHLEAAKAGVSSRSADLAGSLPHLHSAGQEDSSAEMASALPGTRNAGMSCRKESGVIGEMSRSMAVGGLVALQLGCHVLINS
jgi:pyruvate kinase